MARGHVAATRYSALSATRRSWRPPDSDKSAPALQTLRGVFRALLWGKCPHLWGVGSLGPTLSTQCLWCMTHGCPLSSSGRLCPNPGSDCGHHPHSQSETPLFLAGHLCGMRIEWEALLKRRVGVDIVGPRPAPPVPTAPLSSPRSWAGVALQPPSSLSGSASVWPTEVTAGLSFCSWPPCAMSPPVPSPSPGPVTAAAQPCRCPTARSPGGPGAAPCFPSPAHVCARPWGSPP